MSYGRVNIYHLNGKLYVRYSGNRNHNIMVAFRAGAIPPSDYKNVTSENFKIPQAGHGLVVLVL
jgi:hypothetical protein